MKKTAKKPVVMVVDDSKTILRTARIFLEDAYEVVTASNGFEALAAVQDARPDLLFLDVLMPKLDGFHACLTIKDNPNYQRLPVIMLSSKDSPFDKARAQMMGCDGYLTKPFSKGALIAAVERHLPGGEG